MTEGIHARCYGAGSQGASPSEALPPPPVLSRPAPARPDLRPVLVIRPGGLGDAAVLLPLLAAWRAELPADVRLDILCEPRNAAVFGLFPLPNTRILLYTAHPLSLRRRLRRAGYAAVLDTEQSHWFSAIFAAWTKAPVRIGFDTVPGRSRLYTHVVPYESRGPEREQFRRLLDCAQPREGTATQDGTGKMRTPRPAATVPDPVPPVPGLVRPAQSDHGTVVLHIGGSNPSKHWPAKRYAALCDALQSRRGLRAVLVGSAADRGMAARIVSLCRSAAPENRTGGLSLAETAALCSQAALFIGPDSGIAHLADLAGTPSVVLFGSGDEAKWGPCHGVALRAQPPVGCAPCARFGTLHRRRGCRYECMTAITPEAVLAAVEARLRCP